MSVKKDGGMASGGFTRRVVEAAQLSRTVPSAADCDSIRSDPEAQSEIFYRPFYGRARFSCKTAQFCATHCESKITNYLASATTCKAVNRCAIR
ncbi:MAG: hypothetical protein DME65_07020 [Verrucomicrobia bacterium]|nr:MAG: hypothetical protein DME65_07020 [Verrucomicrobiota bacterium]